MIYPPDQGRGVEFALWVYCWNCMNDWNHLFPAGYFGGGGGGGGKGGKGGGGGAGGGGCFLIIICPPHIPCLINCPKRGHKGDPGCKQACSYDPTDPSTFNQPDIPDQPDQPESSSSCKTMTISRTGTLTITASCIIDSCPLKVDVSPTDDQGENGVAPSCPYIGNMTVSINDDQGESSPQTTSLGVIR